MIAHALAKKKNVVIYSFIEFIYFLLSVFKIIHVMGTIYLWRSFRFVLLCESFYGFPFFVVVVVDFFFISLSKSKLQYLLKRHLSSGKEKKERKRARNAHTHTKKKIKKSTQVQTKSPVKHKYHTLLSHSIDCGLNAI